MVLVVVGREGVPVVLAIEDQLAVWRRALGEGAWKQIVRPRVGLNGVLFGRHPRRSGAVPVPYAHGELTGV